MDLLEALRTGAAPSYSEMQERILKLKRSKRPPKPDAPRRRVTHFHPIPIGIITQMTRTTCLGCSHIYEAPASSSTPSLIKWKMNAIGTAHTYTPCHHPIPHLPYLIEWTNHSIVHCPQCYSEAPSPTITAIQEDIRPLHIPTPQKPCTCRTPPKERPNRPYSTLASKNLWQAKRYLLAASEVRRTRSAHLPRYRILINKARQIRQRYTILMKKP